MCVLVHIPKIDFYTASSVHPTTFVLYMNAFACMYDPNKSASLRKAARETCTVGPSPCYTMEGSRWPLELEETREREPWPSWRHLASTEGGKEKAHARWLSLCVVVVRVGWRRWVPAPSIDLLLMTTWGVHMHMHMPPCSVERAWLSSACTAWVAPLYACRMYSMACLDPLFNYWALIYTP